MARVRSRTNHSPGGIHGGSNGASTHAFLDGHRGGCDGSKLNRQLTLEADGAVQILLDFDGDKSIREQGGGKNKKSGTPTPETGKYSLQPVVSVVSVTAQQF